MKSSIKDYGLTLVGLKIKPFDVIVTEIQDELTAKLGRINLKPPSLFSMIINIFAEREALIWQLTQQTYDAMYPGTAEGVSLDGVCALTGVVRLAATKSTVECQLTAVNYTTISAGSEVLVENSNNIFVLDKDITINNEKCTQIVLQVASNEYANYKITINSVEIAYGMVLDNATSLTIASALVDAINDSEMDISASATDAFINITSNSDNEVFSCYVTDGLSIVSCTSNASFTSKVTGNIATPKNTVNKIQTPSQGWISVNNSSVGDIGRNLETDIELRARRDNSLRISGSGTVEAMKARLLSINSVTYAEVIDNRTNVTVDDLPPKSFKVTVAGGTDLEVGQVIWQSQPIGIESVGNTTVTVKDTAGKDQAVKFSRPTEIATYINIVLTVSELFIDESISTIKQALMQRVKNLKLGEPLILQSLYSDIYLVPGIKNAVVTIGKSLSNLVSQDITVGASEILTIDENNITISRV